MLKLVLILSMLMPAFGQIPDSERQALIDFYNKTNGPNWFHHYNWLEPPGTECDWDSVGCNSDQTHVQQFFPIGNNLVGTIPPSLADLTFLDYLVLYDNALSGEIPPEIGRLSKLNQIDFHNNLLEGNIPAEICGLPNLQFLFLDQNRLSGIPTEIGEMKNLNALDLHSNLLNLLPETIRQCINLQYLDISDNYLQGEMPSALCQMSQLIWLDMDKNSLQGELPPEIGDLSNISLLYLSNNQFTGEVPKSIVNLTTIPDAGDYGFPPHYQWFLNIGYNALYTDDPEVIAYLNHKFPLGYDMFKQVQTVAPKGVKLLPSADPSTRVLNWQPIDFQRFPGGYEVLRSNLPGGPYALAGTVPDKTVSNFIVNGLEPTVPCFFAVRSYTDPHEFNRNKVFSELSPDVEAGPAFTQLQTFAAHAASTSIWWTRIFISNAGDTPTTLTFQALDPSGVGIESAAVGPLPANACYQANLEEIFSPATLAHDIWFRVFSDSPVKGVLAFGTRDGQSAAVMPIAGSTSQELVFPYVYAGENYYTGITLVNPGVARAHVQIESFAETGEMLAEKDISIPARGKYVRLVDQIADLGDPQRVRLLQVSADQPLSGFELFGSFSDGGLAGLPAFSLPQATPLLGTAGRTSNDRPTSSKEEGSSWSVIYNEVPDPNNYYTGITFSNFGSQPTQVSAELYGASGTMLAQRTWTVNSMEQVTREIWFVFNGTVIPDAAYLKATATAPLLGFELYLTRPGIQSPYRFDGLAGISAGGTRLCFPMARPGDGWASSLRLTNTSSAQVSFSIHTFAGDGSEKGTFSDNIPPSGQKKYGLEDMFPVTVSEIAWFYVEAQGPIIGDLFCLSSDLKELVSYVGF